MSRVSLAWDTLPLPLTVTNVSHCVCLQLLMFEDNRTHSVSCALSQIRAAQVGKESAEPYIVQISNEVCPILDLPTRPGAS